MRARSLTIDDYDQMVRLWLKVGLPFKPKGRDGRLALEAQMKLSPEFFVGAFESLSLVGVVVVGCDGRKGWINRPAVDPDCRRRGIAKALIAEAEKVSRKQGVKVFVALISDSNEASKSLFRECGYIQYMMEYILVSVVTKFKRSWQIKRNHLLLGYRISDILRKDHGISTLSLETTMESAGGKPLFRSD